MVLLDGDHAAALADRLRDVPYNVASVESDPFTEKPRAPFTTSTLQQESGRKLRFTASPSQVRVGSVVRTTRYPRRRSSASIRCAIVVFPAPSMPSSVMKRPRTGAASSVASKKVRADAPRVVATARSQLSYRVREFRAAEPPLLAGV